MLVRIASSICLCALLAACGEKAIATNEDNTVESAEYNATIAALSADFHKYEEKDGDTYMYVTAISEEDRKKGVALGTVLMYRYLGKKDGKYHLASVNDSGRIFMRYECSDPCKIIKMTGGGETSRIPYDPSSVIGSAFEDAINGKLAVAGSSAEAQPAENSAQSTQSNPISR